MKHSVAGLSELTSFLQSISGPESKAELACIVETTYGLLITADLPAGYAVNPVNPTRLIGVGLHREPRPIGSMRTCWKKVDRADFPDVRQLKPERLIIAELKALTRDQVSLLHSQTRLVNQLTACLKAYYLVAFQLFGTLQQTSTLPILQTDPTPRTAMTATIQHLEMTRRVGHQTSQQSAAGRLHHL